MDLMRPMGAMHTMGLMDTMRPMTIGGYEARDNMMAAHRWGPSPAATLNRQRAGGPKCRYRFTRQSTCSL
jgi:hypothetical protein